MPIWGPGGPTEAVPAVIYRLLPVPGLFPYKYGYSLGIQGLEPELKVGFCAAAVESCRRKSGTARDGVWDGAAF